MWNGLSRILTKAEAKLVCCESPFKNTFRCSKKMLLEHLIIEKKVIPSHTKSMSAQPSYTL